MDGVRVTGAGSASGAAGALARGRHGDGARLLLAAVFASGCTEFEPGADTIIEGTSGSLQPASTDDTWGCLGTRRSVAPTPVVSNEVARVVFSIQIADLSTGQTRVDATVRACGLADLNCETPVTGALPLDARGWVDVPLFAGFAGYLEITSPDMLPELYFLTEPLPSGSVTEFPLATVLQASIQPLVELVGVPYQLGTGVVALRAFDCSGNTASGVSFSFSSDGDGAPWYFVGGLPTGAASDTSSSGVGGLVNVTPGLVVVDALSPDGASIAGPQTFVTRPGWISTAHLRARPATP